MQIVNYFYILHKQNAFRTGANTKLSGRALFAIRCMQWCTTGKGGIVRLSEGGAKRKVSRRRKRALRAAKPVPDSIRETETAYKAQPLGELAPHNKAQDSGNRVNLRLCSESSRSYPGRSA